MVSWAFGSFDRRENREGDTHPSWWSNQYRRTLSGIQYTCKIYNGLISPSNSKYINVIIYQVPDGTASWHVAVSKHSDSPLLSAALPVWDSSNRSIVAVVGVTTALYSVGQLMKELVEFHSGHIYLTSQQGYLLATSTNTPLLNNTTKGRPKLIMAVDSQDHVIKSGAEWLNQTYGNNYPPSHEVHVENAKIEEQQYYIDSFFLNLKRLPLVSVWLG